MDARRILGLLDDPPALEELYRGSPADFESSLAEAIEQKPESIVLRVWKARLSKLERPARLGLSLGPVIAIALFFGMLARLPAIWLGEDWYYPRFVPYCVMMSLALYFWFRRKDRRLLAGAVTLAVVTGVFASFLPELTDSVLMSLVHLPIIWWIFLGIVFTAPSWRETESRIDFLRYNGELLILGSLVALGGIVLSWLTVALFQLVVDGAEEWYFENIGFLGLTAIPVAATYLYDNVFNRHTGIASVLARVFSPLFLVMTCAYLIVAFIGGRNPFLDRSFLITVNGLLLVVLGMVVLSAAERGDDSKVGWVDYVQVALLAVTFLIDVTALSAIVFRLSNYGLTPNRVVVLGMNIVILFHLVSVFRAYVRFARGSIGMEGVHQSVCGYLPAYGVWAALVAFLLPPVFRFS